MYEMSHKPAFLSAPGLQDVDPVRFACERCRTFDAVLVLCYHLGEGWEKPDSDAGNHPVAPLFFGAIEQAVGTVQ